ncbi:MAG: hypothetical protein AAF678_05615 [Pseudomonadota bacterium]
MCTLGGGRTQVPAPEPLRIAAPRDAGAQSRAEAEMRLRERRRGVLADIVTSPTGTTGRVPGSLLPRELLGA